MQKVQNIQQPNPLHLDEFLTEPGLRYPLAIYRMTHNESLKEQTRFATDTLAQYHKSLAGTIIADEYISDLNPNRGAELCIAAELIFSRKPFLGAISWPINRRVLMASYTILHLADCFRSTEEELSDMHASDMDLPVSRG